MHETKTIPMAVPASVRKDDNGLAPLNIRGMSHTTSDSKRIDRDRVEPEQFSTESA